MSIVRIKENVYGLKDNLVGIIATGTERQMRNLMCRIMCAACNVPTYAEQASLSNM